MSNTVIEHAIAIPTKQRHVWEYIRDIGRHPHWRVDCTSISFLSNQISGRGTRWRSIQSSGKAQVIEITAWYEGLGFEYVIVDGGSFTTNRGRLRLQEVPEGTIVQWMFSYELTGFLSGLRNSVVIRRKIDNEIIDSLRNLYTIVKQARGDEQFRAHDASSFPREAPDVEARANYQPRYPSALEQKADSIHAAPEAPASEPRSTKPEGISEPPVIDDDTQPNIPVQGDAPTTQEALQEPTFLKDIPTASPQKPIEATEPQIIQAPPVEVAKTPEIADSRDLEEAVKLTPEEVPALLDSATIPAPQKPSQVEVSTPPELLPEPSTSGSKSADLPRLPGLPDDEITDTSKISVFEIFGLPKPSDTELVRAIRLEDERPDPPSPSEAAAFMDGAATEPDIEPEPQKRSGLRAALRRKHSKVRQPK